MRAARTGRCAGDEFVTAMLENRKPVVDVAQALNMTVAGIVARKSAMKGGELLKDSAV